MLEVARSHLALGQNCFSQNCPPQILVLGSRIQVPVNRNLNTGISKSEVAVLRSQGGTIMGPIILRGSRI